jgi:hypothetical protein
MSSARKTSIMLTIVVIAFGMINSIPRHYQRPEGSGMTLYGKKYGLPFTFLDTNSQSSSFVYQSVLGNLTVLGVVMIGVQVALEGKRMGK